MYERTDQATSGARSLPVLVTTVLLSLALAWLPLAASAVTINVNPHPEFDNPAWGFENPNYDSNGAKLHAIMEAAALYWSDIIRDPHVINVSYFYKSVNGTKLAWACYPMNATECAGDLPAVPNTGWIAIDRDRQWFFDPTPYDHSEFDMQQTLVRDLSPADITEYYAGPVPDLLEVSYFGEGSPAVPQADKPNVDMFSVVLHEMGHLLGMANAVNGDEVGMDGVYDFDPAFVDQAAIGARVNVTEGNEHLQAENSLMEPMGSGERKLPTATDVFAIAAAAGWTDIHLPRRERWGGPFYHLPSGWSGNKNPEASTDVWVRWGGATGLNTDAEVNNLVVSDDSQLWTMGQTLQVGGYATAEQGAGTGASTLGVDGDLVAGGVRARDGGTVAIADGHVQALLVETEAGGTLVADGTVDAVSAWALYNDGTLASSGGGLLVVNTLPDLIDLDGPSDSGEVEAVGGDLLLQDALSDPFDGVMTVGADSTVNLVEPWTLSSGGQLILAGGIGGDQARIEGGELDLQGAVEVTGQARIASPLNIGSSATVTVEAGSELELQSLTELAGGTYTGPGTIQLNGDVEVTSPTVMATGRVDLDGGGLTQIDLDWGLTLQVDGIDTFNNVFNGTVNVQSWLASLRVFLTDPLAVWEIDGVLDLSAHSIWSTVQLDGNDVVIDGTLNVDGVPWLNASIDLRGTLSTADAGARALLNSGGVNVFRNTATVAGSGRVVVRAGTELQLENGFDEPMRLDNEGTVTAGVETGNPIAMPRVLFYTQTANGDLELEIGGPTAGVDHDRLRAMGNVELAGTLRVELANGFVPQLGDSFYLVTASGSVTGTWDTTELPALDPRLGWNLVYGSDTVLLEVVMAP